MAEFQWRNSNGCLSATMVLRAPLRRVDAVSTALEDEYSPFGLWNHDLVNYDSINGEQWDNARNFAYFGLGLR